MRLAHLLCLSLLAPATARADDGIPPQVLADLKAATVFVKVQTTRGPLTGSGFVAGSAGGSALVVTNRHVAAPRALGQVTGIQVVLNSGDPKAERVLDAVLVAADAEQDLAVLQVTGKDLPKPLDVAGAAAVTETAGVHCLGFPFGEALSTTKGNPAVTVTRAVVSSVRKNDRGEVAVIQLDGNLNPGNSGGPVVDGKGKLVGVAAATIRGSGIGLAVPRAEVARLLSGRGARLSVRPGLPKDGKVEVELSLPLLDPAAKATGVWVRAVPAADLPAGWDKDKAAGQPPLPGGETVQLKVDGLVARGKITLKAGKAEIADHLFQAAVVGAAGTKPAMAEPVSAEVVFDPVVANLPGVWAGPVDGLTEVWVVRRKDGKWEVGGIYLDGAKEVGSFTATDVKVTGGTLSYVHKFLQKPARPWIPGATFTAKPDGDKLPFTWRVGNSTGKRTLVRLDR